MKKPEIESRITEIETAMVQADFWSNKDQAQGMIKELQEMKDALIGVGKFDRGGSIVSILAGAGGDDAEDFVGILLRMYMKFFDKKNWPYAFLNENKNDNGGYRNITLEVDAKNVYGTLKGEAGVHRLVRMSPFNSKGLRHTSFAMVEVMPKIKHKEFVVSDDDLHVEFTRSGGPGGQNVNKRETAVRIVHTPTKLSAFVDSERSQLQNREKAMEILLAKLYNRKEAEDKAEDEGYSLSKSTEIEWGSQMRSYVFHPYQMIKDHRTDTEVRSIDAVLEGDLEPFITAFQKTH
jgi:peptide chain release factor 2